MKIEQKDDALVCPSCGGGNLHQTVVGAFFRKTEDSDTGLSVVLDDKLSLTADTGVDSDISPRRDGAWVQFSCEHCQDVSVLKIYQHKGATYIEWDHFD